MHKRGSDPSNIFAGEICALKIELWDSGLPVSAHAGDTLPTLAATYHVPLWVLTQVNNLSEAAALTKGARIIVPRYLVPTAALSAVSSHAASEQTLICGIKALVRRYAPGYFHASDRLERSALPLRSKPVSTLDERGVLAPKDFASQSESLCAAPKRRKTV